MEWPNELVLKFLEVYENEPVIWNSTMPNHKNRNYVFDAWKRIETKLGNKYSINELKNKKDSLMASFRACVKKVKDSCKSGAGSDDIHKPTWFAYDAMEKFLRDRVKPRETLGSEVNYLHLFNDEGLYLHLLMNSYTYLAVVVLPWNSSIAAEVFCEFLSKFLCCSSWLPRDLLYR